MTCFHRYCIRVLKLTRIFWKLVFASIFTVYLFLMNYFCFRKLTSITLSSWYTESNHSGMKNIHIIFRSIYNFKKDHDLHKDSGKRYAKRRPEFIAKCETIKNTLNHYDYLLAAPKTISLLLIFERTLHSQKCQLFVIKLTNPRKVALSRWQSCW